MITSLLTRRRRGPSAGVGISRLGTGEEGRGFEDEGFDKRAPLSACPVGGCVARKTASLDKR